MYDTEIAIASDGPRIKGEIEIDDSQEYYDLPYVYYKGYQITGESGIEYEPQLNYETGMLRVVIPVELVGKDTIMVSYAGTKYQKIAYLVTIISSIFSVYAVIKIRKHPKSI